MVWLKILCTQHIQQQEQINLSLSRPIYQLQKVKRFDADKWIQNGNLCELMLCEVYFWRVFMVFHSTATHLKYKRHHLNSSNWREGVGSICWNLNLSRSFDESQYKNDITECHISKFSALWITVGYECGNFWQPKWSCLLKFDKWTYKEAFLRKSSENCFKSIRATVDRMEETLSAKASENPFVCTQFANVFCSYPRKL